MDVLIIENERPAAERISRLLRKIDNKISIAGILETVEATINWLQVNPKPDLILMDIQLDDGLCFEIFEALDIEVPVIFTTAYDEYTLRAFKVNSIDYLLKPIKEDFLSESLKKYKKLHSGTGFEKFDFKRLFKEISTQYKARFLVKTGTKFKSLPIEDICYFHICERSVFLRDNKSRDYGIDYSLDQLQKILDPVRFFRINRECIISIEAISLIQIYSSSRLQITPKNEKTEDLFIVSRDKVSEFKKWIDR